MMLDFFLLCGLNIEQHPPPIECNKRMFLHYIIFEMVQQKIAYYITLQDRASASHAYYPLCRVKSDIWTFFSMIVKEGGIIC